MIITIQALWNKDPLVELHHTPGRLQLVVLPPGNCHMPVVTTPSKHKPSAGSQISSSQTSHAGHYSRTEIQEPTWRNCGMSVDRCTLQQYVS
jgi:hypothetical protein